MTILVTGATGNIGRRIVDHLIDLGVNDIRAFTKNPAKANLPDGVTPVPVTSATRRRCPPPRGRGTDVPGPAAPDARRHHRPGHEGRRAIRGGAVGAAPWQPHTDAINASGLINTQLGPGEFLENFAIWSGQIKTTRTVREPYPSVVEAPISMDDIARVAADLLVKPDGPTTGRSIRVTGPESLSRAEIARQIGVGIGVEVAFERCSRAETEAALRPIMGPDAAWYLDGLEAASALRRRPTNSSPS